MKGFKKVNNLTMNDNDSCLHSSIILLNNTGCRQYSLGLLRNATSTFKVAMTFVKASCTDTCSVCDVVDAISSSEKCCASTSIPSHVVLEKETSDNSNTICEISFDSMDFSKALQCLNNTSPNEVIQIHCDDMFYQPDSVEFAIISAVILHNISIGFLAIANESDIGTSQLLRKSSFAILQHAEKILFENDTPCDDDIRIMNRSEFNLHTPVVDIVHALIASKVYNIVQYYSEEGEDTIVSYNTYMTDAIGRACNSISYVTSICGKLVAGGGSPAA